MTVLVVQLDDGFRKFRKVRHRDDLRRWRRLRRWWIATAILAIHIKR
jgi:hypothetical protein